jgi:hypothetical protein
MREAGDIEVLRAATARRGPLLWQSEFAQLSAMLRAQESPVAGDLVGRLELALLNAGDDIENLGDVLAILSRRHPEFAVQFKAAMKLEPNQLLVLPDLIGKLRAIDPTLADEIEQAIYNKSRGATSGPGDYRDLETALQKLRRAHPTEHDSIARAAKAWMWLESCMEKVPQTLRAAVGKSRGVAKQLRLDSHELRRLAMILKRRIDDGSKAGAENESAALAEMASEAEQLHRQGVLGRFAVFFAKPWQRAYLRVSSVNQQLTPQWIEDATSLDTREILGFNANGRRRGEVINGVEAGDLPIIGPLIRKILPTRIATQTVIPGTDVVKQAAQYFHWGRNPAGQLSLEDNVIMVLTKKRAWGAEKPSLLTFSDGKDHIVRAFTAPARAFRGLYQKKFGPPPVPTSSVAIAGEPVLTTAGGGALPFDPSLTVTRFANLLRTTAANERDAANALKHLGWAWDKVTSGDVGTQRRIKQGLLSIIVINNLSDYAYWSNRNHSWGGQFSSADAARQFAMNMATNPVSLILSIPIYRGQFSLSEGMARGIVQQIVICGGLVPVTNFVADELQYGKANVAEDLMGGWTRSQMKTVWNPVVAQSFGWFGNLVVDGIDGTAGKESAWRYLSDKLIHGYAGRR